MAKTATAPAETTFDFQLDEDLLDYGVDVGDEGSSYPCIQANMKIPNSLDDEILLCISEENVGKLDETTASSLLEIAMPTTAVFDKRGTKTTVFTFNDDVRYVVLGIPSMFLRDKDEGDVMPNTKQNWKDFRVETTTRIPLLVLMPNGKPLIDDAGNPQIFTLRLNSLKTKMITGGVPGFTSLGDIQAMLRKSTGRKNSMIHLVSLKIVAVPQIFASKVKQGEESLSVFFTIEGSPQSLAKPVATTVTTMMQNPEMIKLLKDPFHLASSEAIDNEPVDGLYEGAVAFDA